MFCIVHPSVVTVVTHFLFSFSVFTSQQTPVSEDSTALFGPPLETAFGEQKNEGNRSDHLGFPF